jgi:glucokinase
VIEKEFVRNISAQGKLETVLAEVVDAIRQVFDEQVNAIGIGVPGLVDLSTGTVYDLNNIPSWEKVAVKDIFENEFNVSVFVNNDANCFALGEVWYGKGKEYDDLLGLVLGTGLGSGIIFNKQLYAGIHCGAGEFGMLPYLDANFEQYASGQFFTNTFNMSGQEMFRLAEEGNAMALAAFEQYGNHLGKALMAIVYTLDPQIIVLGGSVRKSFRFFKDAMWESLKQIEYHQPIADLKIEVSENPHIAVLGAAALTFEAQENKPISMGIKDETSASY